MSSYHGVNSRWWSQALKKMTHIGSSLRGQATNILSPPYRTKHPKPEPCSLRYLFFSALFFPAEHQVEHLWADNLWYDLVLGGPGIPRIYPKALHAQSGQTIVRTLEKAARSGNLGIGFWV